MTGQRQQHAAHDGLDGAVQPPAAPGGLSEPVRSAALCGSMERQLAASGHRVSADPMRPRDSDAFVARDGLRTLAERTKLEWRPGETATHPQATNGRVI
jgi:hypothetical protein